VSISCPSFLVSDFSFALPKRKVTKENARQNNASTLSDKFWNFLPKRVYFFAENSQNSSFTPPLTSLPKAFGMPCLPAFSAMQKFILHFKLAIICTFCLFFLLAYCLLFSFAYFFTCLLPAFLLACIPHSIFYFLHSTLNILHFPSDIINLT